MPIFALLLLCPHRIIATYQLNHAIQLAPTIEWDISGLASLAVQTHALLLDLAATYFTLRTACCRSTVQCPLLEKFTSLPVVDQQRPLSAVSLQSMVLAGVISSVSRGVLSRIRVPVNLQQSGGQVVAAAGSFSIWRSFAKGTYLDKGDVTERVLNVVKHFEKVDENKVSSPHYWVATPRSPDHQTPTVWPKSSSN